ncbi:hypothetical protein [Altibacter sp.]|nr:hypothetical protein [Altibacter sp.]
MTWSLILMVCQSLLVIGLIGVVAVVWDALLWHLQFKHIVVAFQV